MNPWWETPSVRPALDYPVFRSPVTEVLRRLRSDSARYQLLVGPRRVGKTTGLQQVAGRLLRENEPRSVCYLRLDDPDLAGRPLGEVMEVYRNRVWSRSRLAFVLLDEVHEAKDWARWLKTWSDSREPLRIAAAGSLAPRIVEGSRESGPGRWDEVHMPPLDMVECALVRGEVKEAELVAPSGPWWERAEADPGPLPRKLWQRYLLQGGFPEAAQEGDLATAHRRLREDIYERVLIRDMAVYFHAQSFDLLRRLFRYLAATSSGISNLAALSSNLASPGTTVTAMLDRLLDSLLIARTAPFAGGKTLLRARAKVYLCDASLRSAVLLHGPSLFEDREEYGRTLETAVHAHLAAFVRRRGGELAYWRDARGEVDFVVSLPGRPPLPIEVKAGTGTKDKVPQLRRCAGAVGSKLAIVLSMAERIGVETVEGLHIHEWPAPAFLWNLAAGGRRLEGGALS